MFDAGSIKWGTPTLGEPSGTVTWTLAGMDYGPGGLPLGAGANEAGMNATLRAAFQRWEDVAAIDFVEVAGASADIQVFETSLGTDGFGNSIAGQALIGPVFDGFLNEISFVDISFSTDLTWTENGSGFDNVDFYAVALHEIGHAIGLNHVNDTSEIMNPTVFASDLGDGDIDGAQYLYGRDGDDPVGSGSGPSGQTNFDSEEGSSGGGLLLGLLALIAGLFSGGAAVALFAGQVALDEDDDPAPDPHAGHDHTPDENGVVTHNVYVPQSFPDGTSLPMLDCAHDDGAGGVISDCGHVGPCTCDQEQDFDLI